MIVIVDTNVLISAAIRDRVPQQVIEYIVAHGEVIWVASREILTEYRDVLGRPKFGLSDETRRAWLELLEEAVVIIEVDAEVDFPRDRKDAKFLACAVVAEADYFVTGDKDFADAPAGLRTKTVSVTTFKQLVCDAS